MTDKYSLWIAPEGEAGGVLTTLIQDLAAVNGTRCFVPHITLVANIMAGKADLKEVVRRSAELASRQVPFEVTLTGYGFQDDEFHCLYLHAQGNYLDELYQDAEGLFPQVADEHFADMPHISVMYGDIDEVTKNGVIKAHLITPLMFTVNTFYLYKTNNPVESWCQVRRFSFA